MKTQTQKLTITETKNLLADRGFDVTVQTIRNWMVVGCRGIKLKAQRVGRLYFCSEEDLDRFIEEVRQLTLHPLQTMRDTKEQRASSLAAEARVKADNAKSKRSRRSAQ